MSRSISTALLIMPFFMLTACGSNPEKTGSNAVQVSSLDSPDIGVVEYRPKTGAGNYSAFRLGGDYANYAATRQFVDRMVDQHGFSRSYLNGLFSKVERQDGVLEILASFRQRNREQGRADTAPHGADGEHDGGPGGGRRPGSGGAVREGD